MNPLRQQMQNLAQAPGVATNPFEKILAGFGIVRDDVRRAALQQHVYGQNRQTDLDFAARNREASLEHGKKLADSLPADVESYESSPLGGVSMRRRHISSVQPKQPKAAGNNVSDNVGNPALQAPAAAPTRAAVAGKPKKREATIKDVHEAIASGEIDKEQGAAMSKNYAAQQGRKATGAAVKAGPKPPRPPQSNVGPTMAVFDKKKTQAPTPQLGEQGKLF